MSRGNVYFIRDGIGHIKIGIAENVTKRLKSLQTSNALELKPLAVMRVPTIDDAKEIERYLHEFFAYARVRLEWFYEKDVIEYLAQEEINVPGWRFPGFKEIIEKDGLYDGLTIAVSDR